jgi:transcriptional regulator with XRE-family HTH domain
VADNQPKEQGSRLKKLRKALGKTQVQFAEEVDVTQSLISAIEHGNRAISSGIAQSIMLAYPNINMDWLLTGRGSIMIDANTLKNEADPVFFPPGMVRQLRGSDAEEPTGNYAVTQADVDQLRRKIKRLEQFITKKFPDFSTD